MDCPMTRTSPPGAMLDLVCFSYLADASILTVAAYPAANTGAVVHTVHAALAADGPITALTAAGLGLRTGLITNPVGTDDLGHRVLDALNIAGVTHTIATVPGQQTPAMTVISDHAGTRTWFAYLDHAYTSLLFTDLQPIGRARLAYIDCYAAITAAAVRAITAAATAGVPMLLNLGSDPLHPDIRAAAAGHQIAAVQTGLPESDADQADHLADELHDALHPQAAIVTLGSKGAIAATATTHHRAPATAGTIQHTHGAGAAFSAGYAHAHLNNATVEEALRHACQTGSTHCMAPPRYIPRQHKTPAATAMP